MPLMQNAYTAKTLDAHGAGPMHLHGSCHPMAAVQATYDRVTKQGNASATGPESCPVLIVTCDECASICAVIAVSEVAQ